MRCHPKRRIPWATGRGFGLALGLTFALLAGSVPAQEMRFLRIGTGAVGETYFALGGMIAAAISHPPGSRPCDRGGSCGVPGLIAVAQSTEGSVDNVDALLSGRVDSALVQADVVYLAYRGTGSFQAKGPAKSLRAIANLFPSTVHIVVRRDSGIAGIEELRGRRVSLGEEGSESLINARIILSAFGLSEDDVEAIHLRAGPASDRLAAGELDAFFVVGGVPVTAVGELARRVPIRLLPIADTIGEEIRSFYPFFHEAEIQAGDYPGVGYTPSVGVSSQWILREDADLDLVYGITKALWHKRTLTQLHNAHPEGKRILLERALDRIAIPLHPGAARYYAEVGMKR